MNCSDETLRLGQQIKVARNELKNLRNSVDALKRLHRKEVTRISDSIHATLNVTANHDAKSEVVPKGFAHQRSTLDLYYNMKTIGTVSSIFADKNGTPRQSSIASNSRASLVIDRTVFNNPAHALEGLEQYSHLWLIFVFHKNGPSSSSSFTKAKTHPPRLGGESVGVFACRSPHRPNPIGLTLAKIRSIDGDVVHLEGVDLIDGTPVLDVKPFIPKYDGGQIFERHGEEVDATRESCVKTADWVTTADRNGEGVKILFSPVAEAGLEAAVERIQSRPTPSVDADWSCDSVANLRSLLVDVLRADPRSVYRKQKCQDRLYFVEFAGINVTCWFDDESKVVNVLKIAAE